jgi:hypothetical protein
MLTGMAGRIQNSRPQGSNRAAHYRD